MDLADPLRAPSQIVHFLLLIVVHIVLVPDVKGRVGKDQIDRACLEGAELLDAVALMELVSSRSQHVPH